MSQNTLKRLRKKAKEKEVERKVEVFKREPIGKKEWNMFN
jgi:hypothetical protein